MALPDGQPVDHLRLLALVTLKNDLQHRGVLCFEDPENGVHPFHLTLYTPTQQRSPATFALRP
jgi:predicted ATPase